MPGPREMPHAEREHGAGEHAGDAEGEPEPQGREDRDARLARRHVGGGGGRKLAQRLPDPAVAEEEGEVRQDRVGVGSVELERRGIRPGRALRRALFLGAVPEVDGGPRKVGQAIHADLPRRAQHALERLVRGGRVVLGEGREELEPLPAVLAARDRRRQGRETVLRRGLRREGDGRGGEDERRRSPPKPEDRESGSCRHRYALIAAAPGRAGARPRRKPSAAHRARARADPTPRRTTSPGVFCSRAPEPVDHLSRHSRVAARELLSGHRIDPERGIDIGGEKAHQPDERLRRRALGRRVLVRRGGPGRAGRRRRRRRRRRTRAGGPVGRAGSAFSSGSKSARRSHRRR